eukprot:4915910-Pleurochrysis_carterae.AAC.1
MKETKGTNTLRQFDSKAGGPFVEAFAAPAAAVAIMLTPPQQTQRGRVYALACPGCPMSCAVAATIRASTSSADSSCGHVTSRTHSISRSAMQCHTSLQKQWSLVDILRFHSTNVKLGFCSDSDMRSAGEDTHSPGGSKAERGRERGTQGRALSNGGKRGCACHCVSPIHACRNLVNRAFRMIRSEPFEGSGCHV